MAITTRGQLIRDDSNFPVAYNKVYLSGATLGNVKQAPGILAAISFNNPASGDTITIYDSLTPSGKTIANIVFPASPQPVTLFFECGFSTGCTILFNKTTVGNITVSYI